MLVYGAKSVRSDIYRTRTHTYSKLESCAYAWPSEDKPVRMTPMQGVTSTVYTDKKANDSASIFLKKKMSELQILNFQIRPYHLLQMKIQNKLSWMNLRQKKVN